MKCLPIVLTLMVASVYGASNPLNDILNQLPSFCKPSAPAVTGCFTSISKLLVCSDQKPSAEQCKIVGEMWDCMRNATKDGKLEEKCAPIVSDFSKNATAQIQPNCTLDNGYKNECSPAIDISWEKIYVYVKGECVNKKLTKTCYDVTKPSNLRTPVAECGGNSTTVDETCGQTGGAAPLQSIGLGFMIISIFTVIFV